MPGCRFLLATLLFAALSTQATDGEAQTRDTIVPAGREEVLLSPFPLLELDERIRVWRWYEPRVVGRLAVYAPPESVTVRRTALVVAPWEERRLNVSWGEIHRLDRADGRAILQGAAGGAGAALLAGQFGSFFCSSFGGENCGVLDTAVKAAPFTVPIGLVWGFLHTDWDRVYEAPAEARPPLVVP